MIMRNISTVLTCCVGILSDAITSTSRPIPTISQDILNQLSDEISVDYEEYVARVGNEDEDVGTTKEDASKQEFPYSAVIVGELKKINADKKVHLASNFKLSKWPLFSIAINLPGII